MYLHISKLCFLFSLLSVQVSSDKECGIINASKDKIVGGRDVGYVEYPWYAAFFLAKRPRDLMCGGSLISRRYVVTAAHCFKPFQDAVKKGLQTYESIFIIKLGTNNRCMPESTQEVYTTCKVFLHEKYFANVPYYDIALVELDNDANKYTPICLPPVRYESNNRSKDFGVIVGLGKEASGAFGLPCTLKEAEVPIQPDSVCKTMLESVHEDSSKFQGTFCAGYPEGGIDTCQGDSGGPLQMRMSPTSEQYMLLGVTSFGYGCGQANFYGVYTDVSQYCNWLYDKMGTTPTKQPTWSSSSAATAPSAPSTSTETLQAATSTAATNGGRRVVRRRRPQYNKNVLQMLLDI